MSGVPPVPTFTTNEILTSADVNKMAAGLNFALYNRPLFRAHASIVQSIPNIAVYGVNFDVTDIDTDGGRSGIGSAADRYVCRTQGWYTATAVLSYAANSVGSRTAALYVNGAPTNGIALVATPPSTNAGVTITGLIHMNVGDFFQAVAYQDSGAALNTAVTPTSQASCAVLVFELAG